MPRIRSVHPDICTDEGLVGLPASAERLYVRLWTHLDDDGRCVDNPKLIKAALFPLDDDVTIEDIITDLDRLVLGGQLIRYENAGRHYLTAKPERWVAWQKPRRRVDSKHPAPTRADIVRTPRDNVGTCAAGGVDGGETETEGESEGEPPRPSQTRPPVDNPVVGGLVNRAQHLATVSELNPAKETA